MPRTYNPFNRSEIISSNLRFLQDAKADDTADRFIDGLFETAATSAPRGGILTPAGSTAPDIQNGLLTEFTITAVSGTNITVSPGIAYDITGERIEIPAGDTTPHNPSAPSFTTLLPSGGSVTTPYSTGNTGVFGGLPDSDLNDIGLRFVFIRYVQIVKTKALPPNHGTSTGTVVTPSNDNNKALTEIDQKTGQVFAPQLINGYEILVAKTADLTVGTQSSGTPILAVDQNAIFIGQYELVGGPPATGISNIILSDANRPRKLLRFRSLEAVTIDSTNPPIVYVDGQVVTFQEHASATGTGVISATNPHGLAITDITGGGLEPENVLFQKETTADGLIDLQFSSNHPIGDGSALDPLNVNAAVVGTGFLARVEFKQLTADQHFIYVDGERLTDISPRLSDFDGVPANTQAIVGFSGSDVEGDYIIFAQKLSLTTGTLNKILSTSPLPAASLPIVKVFWRNDGGANQFLRRSTVSPSSNTEPIDLRSFGTVSKPQISTEGMADANKGTLAAQTFFNSVANNDFRVTTTPASTLPQSWDTNIISTGTLTPEAIDTTDDSTMASDNPGPKSLTGIELVFGSPPSNLDMRFKGDVPTVKSNAVYTLSVWFKLVDTLNSLETSVRLINASSSPISNEQVLNYNRDDAGWQRLSVALTTTAGAVLTDLGNELEFIFKNNTGTAPTGDLTTRMTKVYLLEGDWVTEFVGPIMRSGEIFMWDKTTTCPPGSELVTELQGRVPVGANGSMAVGDVSAATQQTSFNVTATVDTLTVTGTVQADIDGTIVGGSLTAVAGAHTHAPSGIRSFDGGSSTGLAWIQPHVTTINGAHQHSLSGVAISGVNALTNTSMTAALVSGAITVAVTEYALLFCRRK